MRTFIHILCHTNGSYGITFEQAEDANYSLNVAFLPYNIKFELMGVDEIFNTQLFTNIHDSTIYYQNSSVDRIDIYIAPGPTDDAPTISWAQGHYGQNNYQPNPGISISGDSYNSIVCDQGLVNQELFASDVLIHEMGHVLGLLHTHSTSYCDELIDGSNCDTCGDLVCDTPAAPNIVCNSVDMISCAFLGGIFEPGTGLEYDPDVDNYMAYTFPYCYTHFTQGQTDFMNSWVTTHPNLRRVVSDIIEIKSFHSGWNWVGFPWLVDNEDGVVGNTPDLVEDIFNSIEIIVDSIEVLGYENNVNYSADWNGDFWDLSGGLTSVLSTKGYKVELPNNQDQYDVPFSGARVPAYTPIDLNIGENWVPYFIPEPQRFTDAFPENVLDKIQTIKSENWFIYKNSNGQFIMNQICPEMYMDGGSVLDCYNLYDGSMVEVVVDEDIQLIWNNPGGGDDGTIDPPSPLISEKFPFKKKSDYIPLVIESIDSETEIEEIGAKKSDKYVGAEFVGGFPVNMRVYDNNLAGLTFETSGEGSGLGRLSDKSEIKQILGISQSRIENGIVFVQLTNIGDVLVESPKLFSLVSAYPNPMNPSVEIHFSLMKDAKVELGIYDIMGRKLTTIVKGNLISGNHSYQWNSKDEKGTELSSGIYLYRLQGDGEVIQNKIMLLK